MAIAALSWPAPGSPSGVARYLYGGGSPDSATVDQVRAALSNDVWFIAGYGLALTGFAWIFRLWAISEFGRLAAKYVAAAVALTVGADLAKHVLLDYALRHHNSADLITAAAAASIIKWCAGLLALGGCLATLGVFLRALVPWSRRLREGVSALAQRWRWLGACSSALTWPWRSLRAYLRKAVAGSRWFKACAPGKTEIACSDSIRATWWRGLQAEPPAARAKTDELSWANAYYVPGAEKVRKSREGDPVQAICLSGGGVRSACIAMGVTQEFSKAPPIKLTPKIRRRFRRRAAAPKLIDAVDYVISVSGGGYTAGARLLAVHDKESPLLSERFEEGSPEFDHFRRHSSYIADSPGELLVALTIVLKNLIASMAILFTLPAVLGSVLGYLFSRSVFSFAVIVPVPNPSLGGPPALPCLTAHSASWYAVAAFAAFAVFFTGAAMFVEFVSWKSFSEWLKLRLQGLAFGSAVFAVLVLAVVAGLPALMRLCWWLGERAPGNQGGAAAAVSGLVGLNYLAAIAAMVWKDRDKLSKEATKLSSLKRLLPPGVVALVLVMATLAALLVAWLITLGCFAANVFAHATADGKENTFFQMPFSSWWLPGLLLLTMLWVGSVDIASLSLNPFYRSRLGQAFAVQRVKHGDHWHAEAFHPNKFTWFDEFGEVPVGGPKFVFAAAATITGKDKPAPGLNAVSYVMSHDYIGGPDLGWLKTAGLFGQSPPRIKRDLTVLTAVAVSGAAFASAMGRHQKGFEKLLAISGARLGTWLPNPKFVANLAGAETDQCLDPKDNTRPWPRSLPAMRGAGYYYRELFGFNYSDGRLVQVTDGGHYENLGLVEALRRRSRLIFCVDGGGDAPPLASGLADALRLAEYELGVTVTFDDFPGYSLRDLTPGSGEPFKPGDAFYSLNGRLAKRTVAIGLITYPAASGLTEGEERRGVLIFAKAVLCRDFPEWLLTYAAENGVFPHDPTSDQWFNEGQFAAYTEMGRIMGRQALKCVEFLTKVGKISNPTEPDLAKLNGANRIPTPSRADNNATTATAVTQPA
ncbi:hypothetical protein A5706_04485 [Mycobacterium sp. E796]|nr:hypothetical protein A5706_04485 [Mycobacterium sp. E796]